LAGVFLVGSLGNYFWNAFETKKWRQVETSYAAMLQRRFDGH
jgi:hypothetical protein